jgi:hypothetical protein
MFILVCVLFVWGILFYGGHVFATTMRVVDLFVVVVFVVFVVVVSCLSLCSFSAKQKKVPFLTNHMSVTDFLAKIANTHTLWYNLLTIILLYLSIYPFTHFLIHVQNLLYEFVPLVCTFSFSLSLFLSFSPSLSLSFSFSLLYNHIIFYHLQYGCS